MNHDRVIEGIRNRFGSELKRNYFLGGIRETYEDLVVRVLSDECYSDEDHLQAALLVFYLSIPPLGEFGRALADREGDIKMYFPLRAVVGGEEILDRLVPKDRRCLLARACNRTHGAVRRSLGYNSHPGGPVESVVRALGFLPRRLLAGSEYPDSGGTTKSHSWPSFVIYTIPLAEHIRKYHKRKTLSRWLSAVRDDADGLFLDDPADERLACLASLAHPDINKAVAVMGSNTMKVLDVYRGLPYPCGVDGLGVLHSQIWAT